MSEEAYPSNSERKKTPAKKAPPEKKVETPESFQNESGWTVGYFRDGQWFTE